MFPGFGGNILVAELPQKRSVLCTRIHSLPVNWCCHRIKPRALACLFKQSNLSAWSLLSWHLHTHTSDGDSLFFESPLLSTVIVGGYAQSIGIMSIEVLFLHGFSQDRAIRRPRTKPAAVRQVSNARIEILSRIRTFSLGPVRSNIPFGKSFFSIQHASSWRFQRHFSPRRLQNYLSS